MPRVVEITVPSTRSDEVLRRLREVDELLSLRVLRGASVQPPGDVVVAQVLDRGLAAVMRVGDDLGVGSDQAVSMTTTRPQSVLSAGDGQRIARDRSTSSWEEIDLALGRESTMTAPKLLVMAIAGFFAALGLHTGALHVIVAAMLVAPAYEPLARISVGLVNRSRAALNGLQDFVAGYLVLAAGAAVAALLVLLFGAPLAPSASTYLPNEELERYWTTIGWVSYAVAAAGGIGGALLIVVNRRVLTTGIVIALALVPSLSLAVLELAAGQPGLAGKALLRWLVEVAVVLVACTAVFAVKRQRDGRQMAPR